MGCSWINLFCLQTLQFHLCIERWPLKNIFGLIVAPASDREISCKNTLERIIKHWPSHPTPPPLGPRTTGHQCVAQMSRNFEDLITKYSVFSIAITCIRVRLMLPLFCSRNRRTGGLEKKESKKKVKNNRIARQRRAVQYVNNITPGPDTMTVYGLRDMTTFVSVLR